MKRPVKKPPRDEAAPAVYSLEVTLLGGLVTEEFWEENPVVSRTIEILGEQTLEDLHFAIFDAFGRDDEHMYEFQFGKKPYDRGAKCYVLPETADYGLDEDSPRLADLTETTIDSLGLRVRKQFYYRFDYGDEWWHRVKVKAIGGASPEAKYPRVTERVGESPPQYPDWD